MKLADILDLGRLLLSDQSGFGQQRGARSDFLTTRHCGMKLAVWVTSLILKTRISALDNLSTICLLAVLDA